jgi:calcineurin-like phosphoesterase family protein
MTQRFFTSDPHIGHRLVSGLRGFWNEQFVDGKPFEPDTAAHDAALAANWDAVVGKNDTVFILGDIAMNPRKGAFDWFRERPGIKHLISGNHDVVHPLHTAHLKAQREWHALGIFDSINSQGSVKIDGQKVLLSHFPYEGEGEREGPDRYTEWRFRNEGFPLLHGHEHKKDIFNPAVPNQFHVGVDSHALQLVPESRIVSWLREL